MRNWIKMLYPMWFPWFPWCYMKVLQLQKSVKVFGNYILHTLAEYVKWIWNCNFLVIYTIFQEKENELIVEYTKQNAMDWFVCLFCFIYLFVCLFSFIYCQEDNNWYLKYHEPTCVSKKEAKLPCQQHGMLHQNPTQGDYSEWIKKVIILLIKQWGFCTDYHLDVTFILWLFLFM